MENAACFGAFAFFLSHFAFGFAGTARILP
jgi:hypothetical protein